MSTKQSLSGSIGVKSSAHFLFFMFMIPFRVNSMPFRPLRVGITQSNMSIPRSMPSRRLAGVPTPIRYLGRSFGSISFTTSIISYIFSVGSPTASPPIALPSRPWSAMNLADSRRSSG